MFAAQFIGVPPMNISDLGVSGVKFGFRPESATLSVEPGNSHFSMRGVIATREMLGSETIYQVRSDKHSFMIKCTEDLFSFNQEVYVGVEADKIFFFGSDEFCIDKNDIRYGDYMRALRGQRHG
jgi:sn-glycerol 3-phosphate transport system ATP-binding protein